MGMSESEFLEMRIGTFFLKMRYFFKLEDSRIRQIAELFRMQTLYLFNIQLDPANRIKEPRELWPLPWDVIENKVQEVSPEEAREQVQKLLQLHQQAYGEGV